MSNRDDSWLAMAPTERVLYIHAARRQALAAFVAAFLPVLLFVGPVLALATGGLAATVGHLVAVSRAKRAFPGEEAR